MKKALLLLLGALYLFASQVDKRIELFNETVKLNALEHKSPIRDLGEAYAQLQPPSYANVYNITWYDDKAKVYIWFQDGKNFIRIEPQNGKFFACSSSFVVIDAQGAQRKIKLLQNEYGSSFCDDLFIPVTFRIKAYSFDKFDDTKPIQNLIYNSDKTYHLSAGVSNGSSASSQTSSSSSATNCLQPIQETTNPNSVKTAIVGKSFNINGYYIHYGPGTFDWIYIGRSSKQVYKLEKGVNDDYSLRWTHIPGVSVEINGNKVNFK